MIFMFTFLPVVGILVEDQNSIYGLEHLKNANLIHICIMYVGLLLAYMKIKQKGYFWEKVNNGDLYIPEKLFEKVACVAVLFVLFQFSFQGHMILSGVDRGIVRSSIGVWGPLTTYVGRFGMPALLSLSTVLYFYIYDHSKKINRQYVIVVICGILVAIMAGGEEKILMIFFSVIFLFCGLFLKKKIVNFFFFSAFFLYIYCVLFGALSIVIVGMFQMNMSFAQSVSYNIYRATSLSNMGTLCVWDKFPTGDPQAYMSLLIGLGERIISFLFDVDRHSVEFLKFSLPRYITYLYYGNAQGAIDGVVNLTITSFGEAVYWFGRKFYFIASLIFAFVLYKISIWVFKTRKKDYLLKNVIVSVFFTSLCLGWLISTSGCFLSYFFGFTSLVYLFGTYMLIKYVLKGSSLNK